MRYGYTDLPEGIPETQNLDFHSPYGCSKGAADQYVRDYARIYGLRTVVFRQSCILGPRQFGVEDQGWVAHFVIASVLGRPLSIFGNGKQVRDMLYVDDLVAAYRTALAQIDRASGQIYNIGGWRCEYYRDMDASSARCSNGCSSRKIEVQIRTVATRRPACIYQ